MIIRGKILIVRRSVSPILDVSWILGNVIEIVDKHWYDEGVLKGTK